MPRPMLGSARRVRVQVIMSPTVQREVDAAAAETGASRSAIVERALLAWLAARQKRTAKTHT